MMAKMCKEAAYRGKCKLFGFVQFIITLAVGAFCKLGYFVN
ncbi:hypothetical protein SOVF_157120 isoform B [Spinacia oleracea]|nr:hypothetical protein SOVF_157120 isoform B [Spinacia oleracea]